ncbi:MAG TPA: Hsp20/alpha crystallin family protein [Polyangiaceae bacterium]|nr:Hsp20/alpha crystallin family protein [Polyangiaceae bacterium]HMR79760.1 Hsp20/alpha crystallin family protein [Polyangiaceae bacterium]
MLSHAPELALYGLSAPHTLRSLAQLRDDIDRFWPLPARARAEEPSVQPRLAFTDTGDALEYSVALPGCALEQMEITATEDSLSIAARRDLTLPDGFALRSRERRAWALSRHIDLPCKVSADDVQATYAQGVLSVRLPKAPEAKPRRIEVRGVTQEVAS